MPKVAELWVELGTRLDKFNKGFTDAEQAMIKVGKKLEKVGKDMMLKVTLPIIAFGAASVKAFADFDQAMTSSLAIMGDVSDAMREKMIATAKEMSTKTTYSATQLAEAYYYLASAGMNAEQSIAVLGDVARFAQAGMFDLNTATDLLTDAQSALGLSSKNAAKNQEELVRISDVLVKANTLANASVQQFSEALTNRAGAAIRFLNKDVEEGVAVLAAYADQGRKGSEAGEALNIVLRDLQRAALENKKAFKEAGVAVYDVQGNMRNTADIIADLEGHLGTMTVAQKKAALSTLGFQERSQANIVTLIGTSEKIRDYEVALRKAGGTTKEVSDKQLEAFSAQMKLLKNAVVNAAAAMGEILAPVVKSLVDKIKPAIEDFSKLSKGKKELIAVTAGLVAIMAPLVLIMSKIAITTAQLRAANIKIIPAFGAITAGILAGYAAYKLLLAAREKWERHTGRYTEEETKRWAELNKQLGGFTEFAKEASRHIAKQTGDWSKYRETLARVNEIWHQYGENTEKTLKAIAEGKHGEDLKKFLEELGGKHLEAAKKATEQGKSLEDLEKETEKSAKEFKEKLIKALQETGIATDDTTEVIKELGITLKSELQEKLKDCEIALKKYKDKITPTEEKKLREEIFNLKLELELLPNYFSMVKTEIENAGYGMEAMIDSALKMRKEFKEGKRILPEFNATIRETEKYIANIASQMGITATAVKIGLHNVMADFMSFATGFRMNIPKIIKETTTDIKDLLKSLNENIAAEWIKLTSSMIQQMVSLDFKINDLLNQLTDNIVKMWSDAMGQIVVSGITAGKSIKDIFKDVKGFATEGAGLIGTLIAVSKMVASVFEKAGLVTTEWGKKIGQTFGGITGFIAELLAKLPLVGGLFKGIFKGLFGDREAEEAAAAAKKLEHAVKALQGTLSRYGEVSEETAKKIHESSKALGGFAAVSKHFADVIKDTGITQENINDLWWRAGEILGHYQRGFLSASDAALAADESFDLLLEGAKKIGKEGSAAMVDFILKVRESGIEVASVTEYTINQLNRIPDALVTLIGEFPNLRTEIEELKKTIWEKKEALDELELGSEEYAKAQKEIIDLEKQLKEKMHEASQASEDAGKSIESLEFKTLASFKAMEASGMEWTDIVRNMSPALIALKDRMEVAGITGSEAIQKLFKIAEVTEANKELFDAIEADRIIMEALGNTGFMTGEILNSFAQDAIANYGELKKKFGNSDDALRAMGPTLQKIQDYAEAYNITLDEGTQKLIDQAIEIGAVKKTQEDNIETQKRLFKELGDRMGKIMDDVGGRIVGAIEGSFSKAFGWAESAASDAAATIGDTLSDITPVVDIGFKYDLPDFSNLKGNVDLGFSGEGIGKFQHEAIVSRPTLAWIGERRPEAVVDIEKFRAGTSRLQGVLMGHKGSNIPDSQTIVNLTINAQRLDDYTINHAAEKIYDAVERQKRRH